jgi:probable HAF family extracellular repeat protein
MRSLGTIPGGIFSIANAINNFGEVIGYSSVNPSISDCVHGMHWTSKTGMQDLGTLGGSCSYAEGINDLGQIVGASNTTDHGGNTAFIWTKDRGMQDLNTLIPANSGWVLFTATSINLRGQITGVGTIDNESHAFLLTPTKGL